MPVVPNYGDIGRGANVQQVPVRPLPQNRQSDTGASTLAFGGGLAEGLQLLGGAVEDTAGDVADIATDIAKSDADRDVDDLQHAWDAAVRDELVNGREGRAGYYTYKGQTAVDEAPTTVANLTKLREQFSKQAKTEYARTIFDAKSMNDLDTHLTNVGKYTIKERYDADTATRTAKMANAAEQAAAYPEIDELLDTALMDAARAANDQLIADGVTDPEAQHAAIAAAQSEVLAANIKSMEKMNPAAARARFTQFAHVMDAQTRVELGSMLEKGRRLERGQEIAAQAREMFGDDTLSAARWIEDNFSGEDEEDGLQKLTQQEDLQYKITSRANAEYERAIRQEEQERERIGDAAEEFVIGRINEGENYLDVLRQLDPETQAILNERPRGNFILAEQHYESGEIFGHDTSPEKLAEVQDILSLPREELAKFRYEGREGMFTKNQWTTIKKQVDAARNVMEDAGSRVSAFESKIEGVLKDQFGASWDDRKNLNERQLKEQEAIRNHMRSWAVDYYEDNAKLPTMEEVSAEAANTLRKGFVPDEIGGILGTRIFAGDLNTYVGALDNLTPEQRGQLRVHVDDIDPAMRAAFEDEIRARGLKVTDDLLEQLGGADLANDNERYEQLLRKPATKRFSQ